LGQGFDWLESADADGAVGIEAEDFEEGEDDRRRRRDDRAADDGHLALVNVTAPDGEAAVDDARDAKHETEHHDYGETVADAGLEVGGTERGGLRPSRDGVKGEDGGGRVEWLLEHGDVKKLRPVFLRLLQCDSRPNYLPNWQYTLTDVLLNDTKGRGLEAILRSTDSSDLGKSLAKVVIQTDAIVSALDQLARLAARREPIPGIAILIDEIARLAFDSTGSERERLSAALTRLVGGVALLNDNSPQAKAVQSQIERANRKLKTAVSVSGSTGKIWLAARYPDNQDVPSGKPQLTIEGALNIATAFRKAAEGFGIVEILTFTAKNLGMSPFGTVGEHVVFNPFQHEDVSGGLLRGDQATVVETGWKLGNDIAMRVKVKGMKS